MTDALVAMPTTPNVCKYDISGGVHTTKVASCARRHPWIYFSRR